MTDLLQEMGEAQGIEFNINDPRFQIVDINFAKTNLKDVEILFRLNKVRTQMKKIEARKAKSSGTGESCCNPTFEKQLEKKQEKYDLITDEFYDFSGMLTGKSMSAKVAPSPTQYFK